MHLLNTSVILSVIFCNCIIITTILYIYIIFINKITVLTHIVIGYNILFDN